ncbi:hypothetical protein ACFQX8_04275 [Klenkia terrae]|uniref:hypothetical protein n=1 Tax=Klenkia terrae TaxID=1052259 RepID=UPI00360DC5B6
MSALVDAWPQLLAGLGTTVFVLVTSAVGALVLGTLVTVARVSPVPVLRAAAFGYVQVLVNVPCWRCCCWPSSPCPTPG